MRTLVLALGMLLLGLAGPGAALAHWVGPVGRTAFVVGTPYAAVPLYQTYPYPYGYPTYPYYPYPLPPAPSFGFGRGGIYGHVFVGRDEGVTSYTIPGADSYR